VPIRVKPSAEADVKRLGAEGDLLRVWGVAPGLEGDPGTWWATHEGFVALGQIRPTASEWAQWWGLPGADEALDGWWGAAADTASVRVAGTLEAPAVGQLAAGTRVKVLREEAGEPVDGDVRWYRIDGGPYAGAYVHASLIVAIDGPAPVADRPEGVDGDTWITVSRTARTLTLVQGGEPVFATYVAIRLVGAETPPGLHSTIGKHRVDDFTSASLPNPRISYDYPNVPYTQYLTGNGYSLHGNYWGMLFGQPGSQGCINLSVADAAYLFQQTHPIVPDDADERWASVSAATPVAIVD